MRNKDIGVRDYHMWEVYEVSRCVCEVNVRVQRVIHKHRPKNKKQIHRGCELSHVGGAQSKHVGCVK